MHDEYFRILGEVKKVAHVFDDRHPEHKKDWPSFTLKEQLKTAEKYLNNEVALRDVVDAYGYAVLNASREDVYLPSYDAAVACEEILMAIICDCKTDAISAMSCVETVRELEGKVYDKEKGWIEEPVNAV